MLLQWLWFGMMGASLMYALATGRAEGMLDAALSGTGGAVWLSLRLCAGYMFFCGLVEILKALRVPEQISRALKPMLQKIMPGVPDEQARQAVCLNLTANLLGLGNAATPTGMEAVRLLDAARRPGARHAICMLLILNATSIQLLPTTVLSLRAAAGSAAPQAVLLPTFACTCLSTIVGVGLGLACMRVQEARRG